MDGGERGTGNRARSYVRGRRVCAGEPPLFGFALIGSNEPWGCLFVGAEQAVISRVLPTLLSSTTAILSKASLKIEANDIETPFFAWLLTFVRFIARCRCAGATAARPRRGATTTPVSSALLRTLPRNRPQ